MGRYIDLTGQKFERLLVVSYAGCVNDEAHWNCICDCGNTTRSSGKSLRKQQTKSCGCWRRDIQRKLNFKHGHNTQQGKSKAYSTWDAMLQRCNNSNNAFFFNYGGRGIKVCERWLIFENFLADMGNPEKYLSIERIDNNLGYSPDNCRWASRKEQNLNTRRNVFVVFRDKTQTIKEWSDELKIPFNTLQSRLNNPKWDVERALTTPVQRYTKSNL